MKFLDANGLALFTKRIFSKFVSNITGADNKITITKGDGTTNEINLNEVVKTDVIGEDPPDDDNSNKIPSTRWVQKFVATMVFKLISKLAGTEETGVSSSGSFLGVNWLIAQNGYICFGKLFGGLILQWGKYDINVTKDYTYANINLPLTCNLNEPLFIVPSIMCNHENNTKDFNIQCSGYSTNTISFVIRCLSTTLDNFAFKWCIISK